MRRDVEKKGTPRWAAILEAIAMFLITEVAFDDWLRAKKTDVRVTTTKELFEPLTV